MLKRRRALIIGIAGAVVLLVGGTIGGVVYADSNSTTTPTTITTTSVNPEDTLMAKVASILGIDQTTLENAFTQAEKEVQTDNLTSRLNDLVTAGTITQAQTDQYLQWWNSQPTLPSGVGLPGIGDGRHGMEFGGMGMMGGFRMQGLPDSGSSDSGTTTTVQ